MGLDPARVVDEPLRAWKRAQVLIAPDGADARFAGPVQRARPYRADDVFWCVRGHRRLEPSCRCGFYALPERSALPASVVVTAVLEVGLEGRVVVHRGYVRAERQRVRQAVYAAWCVHCVAPAATVGGVPSLWGDLPAPWLRAVPLCDRHARQAAVALPAPALAALLGTEVRWDGDVESRAARSLRLLRGARGDVAGARRAAYGQPGSSGSSGRAENS